MELPSFETEKLPPLILISLMGHEIEGAPIEGQMGKNNKGVASIKRTILFFQISC